MTKSQNYLKQRQDDFGRASILGTPFFTLGGDRINVNDKIYDLNPEK